MAGRKKLLYIMGIDWNWIYQRPQILEQHLEDIYDVTVVFPRSILYRFTAKRSNSHKRPGKSRILWTIPFQEKNKLIGRTAALFSKSIFRDIYSFDAVLIGYPLYYRYIPDNYQGKLIYDCMDNYEALYPWPKGVGEVWAREKALAEKSDLMFVSGCKLQEKMSTLVSDKNKIVLMRNGAWVDDIVLPKPAEVRPVYKLGYFGTIAEWFDFDLLEQSLAAVEGIEYHLIGPARGSACPENDRIFMEGIVEHERLRDITADYDCLIMPFQVNEVVLWVDPVKLYEYIALGKCVISVRYEEIERFEDFVYLYSGQEEYIDLIRELGRKGFAPKYTEEEQRLFLKSNSWEQRFRQLDRALETVL